MNNLREKLNQLLIYDELGDRWEFPCQTSIDFIVIEDDELYAGKIKSFPDGEVGCLLNPISLQEVERMAQQAIEEICPQPDTSLEVIKMIPCTLCGEPTEEGVSEVCDECANLNPEWVEGLL